MHLLNTRSEYGTVSRALHWIIVLAIVTQWLLSEADEESGQLYAGFDALTLHQSIGLTVLLLAVIRLVWRFVNPKTAWPADMKTYEDQHRTRRALQFLRTPVCTSNHWLGLVLRRG